MNPELLEQAGLNPTQARAYLALISSGSLTPPQLSDKIQITRTNAYEVLSQLAEQGLASKAESGRTLTYRPNNPSALENLMERRRNTVIEQETRLRGFLPQLMTYFYTFSEQPGVRFYQGKEGIIKVYEDILRTRQPLRLIRTPAENEFLGLDFMKRYIAERTKLGITVDALTPDVPEANHDPAVDKSQLLYRTWFDPATYNAPVEIDIYGNKVAFISFGHEAIATIIESPQISIAMQQAFDLMRYGAPHAVPHSQPSAQTPPPDQTDGQIPPARD